jgi:hypothetical protein
MLWKTLERRVDRTEHDSMVYWCVGNNVHYRFVFRFGNCSSASSKIDVQGHDISNGVLQASEPAFSDLSSYLNAWSFSQTQAACTSRSLAIETVTLRHQFCPHHASQCQLQPSVATKTIASKLHGPT